MIKLALGGDTCLGLMPENMDCPLPHLYLLLYFVFSTHLFINLSFFSHSYSLKSLCHALISSLHPSHPIFSFSAALVEHPCSGSNMLSGPVSFLILSSGPELQHPFQRHPFLCLAQVWGWLLQDRASFRRKCAKSGISVKNISSPKLNKQT